MMTWQLPTQVPPYCTLTSLAVILTAQTHGGFAIESVAQVGRSQPRILISTSYPFLTCPLPTTSFRPVSFPHHSVMVIGARPSSKMLHKSSDAVVIGMTH